MTQALTPSLLNVQGLNAWYGAAQVLFNAQLHVQRGEVVALVGRNGAGKPSWAARPAVREAWCLLATTSRMPSPIKQHA